MEETLKFGGSTKSHSPSEQSSITNHGTLRVLVRLKTCKSGAQTLDGSKSSSSMETTSLSRTQLETIREHLMLMAQKILKVVL
jgi:hypothetical protein